MEEGLEYNIYALFTAIIIFLGIVQFFYFMKSTAGVDPVALLDAGMRSIAKAGSSIFGKLVGLV